MQNVNIDIVNGRLRVALVFGASFVQYLLDNLTLTITNNTKSLTATSSPAGTGGDIIEEYVWLPTNASDFAALAAATDHGDTVTVVINAN